MARIKLLKIIFTKDFPIIFMNNKYYYLLNNMTTKCLLCSTVINIFTSFLSNKSFHKSQDLDYLIFKSTQLSLYY